jgi:hypothetical protein
MDLLSDLREAIEQRDPRRRALADELSAMGSAAMPEIKTALDAWPPSDAVWLVRLLGSISGDESTDQLVNIALDGGRGSVARSALGALGNRPIRAEISEQQLGTLANIIGQDNVIAAGAGARVLSRCTAVAGSRRVEMILARFKKELAQPSPAPASAMGYLSSEVSALNQFLLAFSNIGADALPALRRELAVAQTRGQREWLELALGMAGDQDVLASIRRIVETHQDASTRAVAVRAYARSGGQEAVPFLESIKDDETRSAGRGRHGGSMFPIRIAVQGELARLQSFGDADRNNAPQDQTAVDDSAPDKLAPPPGD